MKKIERENVYPCVAEELVKFYFDPDKAKARASAAGAVEVEIIKVDQGEDAFNLDLRRLVDVELPGFAKTLLPAQNTLIECYVWPEFKSAPYSCTYSIEIKKTPVSITGTVTIENLGDGSCKQLVTAEVVAKVPLIGRKLEEFVGANTENSIVKEFEWMKSEVSKA